MNRSSQAFVAGVVLSTLIAIPAHAITADSADDVCPVTADPCLVTEVVEVVPGSTIDFLNRKVVVSGGGRFDFGAGSARLLSGMLEASTDGPAIVATDAGTVTIETRRLCSGGEHPTACLAGSDCQLGACDARRCSARPATFCSSDASCAGTCTSRRCSNAGTVRCTTNAECDFGSCPEQLTCRGGATARNCTANSDCNLGTCSIGQGALVLNGAIDGRSDDPARFVVRAADHVSIAAPVDLSGTTVESDGGALEIRTWSGDIAVSAPVHAKSGGQGTGGELTFEGEQNVVVTAPIDVSGGAGDGGYLDLLAEEGDVVLLADVNLSAKSGYGYAGYLWLAAGRDVRVGNGSDTLRVRANGHTDGVEATIGGEIEIEADRDVHIARGVRIAASASGPGSWGGTVDIFAGDDLTFDGRFNGRSRGIEGGGGTFEVYVTDRIFVGDDARIDVRGFYGAMVDFQSEEGDATLGGLVRLNGLDDLETGSFKIEACDVELSLRLHNGVDDGVTSVFAREGIHLLPEGRLLTPRGDTLLSYGDPGSPPVIEGRIDSILHMELRDYGGCTTCGDGVLDDWEDCDDGNENDGDGCDSDCTPE